MNPLFRHLFGRPKTVRRASPKPPHRSLLELTTLEDRANPVALHVTIPGDSAAGVMDNADASGNSGDLRYVITRANTLVSADTIDFDTKPTGQFGGFTTAKNISLTSALPMITGTLTITGPGLLQPLIDPIDWRLTVDRLSNNNFSILTIAPNATVNLSEFKVSGGSAVNGGGISVPDASGTTLNLTHMEISNNRTQVGAVTPANPGIGGGIGNPPSPATFLGQGGGGGIYMFGPGELNMVFTTVSGNSAFEGGGIFAANSTRLQINRSAVISNISGAGASAASMSGGGGIYMGGSTGSGPRPFLITNSTVAGNSAGSDGGGILMSGYSGPVELQNSTLVYNSSGNLNVGHGGGGIAAPNGASVLLYSSVLKNNAPQSGTTAAPKDILTSGTVEEAFSDIFDLNGGAGTIVPNQYQNFSLSTNINTTDPRLGPLQYNGGLTFSVQPFGNSPLISAGDNTVGQFVTDQRGPGFVRVSAPAQFGLTRADIGSIEFQPPKVILITPEIAGPTNSSSVNFDVYFNQPITSVIDTNFKTAGGVQSPVTTGSINPGFILVGTPSGVSTPINQTNPFFVWRVPLSSIIGDGTVSINMTNATGANPNFILAGNASGSLPFIATADNPTNQQTGQQFQAAITIDQTAPQFVSLQTIPASNPPPVPSGPLTWTVTFNERVLNLKASNFGFTPGGVTAAQSGAIVVTPVNPLADGSSSTWTVTTNFTGNGTLGLQMVNAAGVTDRAGNALGGTFPRPVPPATYIIGRPVVLSINPTVPATNQTTADFVVTFNQPVSGVSVNDFKLNLTNVTANIQSVTPATGFNLQYTVTVAISGLVDQTQNGSISVTMNSSAGTTPVVAEVDPNPPFPGFTGNPVVVDYINPSLVSPLSELTPVTTYGNATNATTVKFGLVFDEAIQAVPQPDLQLTGSVAGAASIAGVVKTGPNSFTVNVTVPANVDGTLGLSVVSPTGILDSAGNTLGNVPPTITEASPYNVDTTAPTVTAITLLDPTPTNAPVTHQVRFNVAFSEPVFNLSSSNFQVVPTGTTDNGFGVASVTAVNPGAGGSSANWTITVNTGLLEGTLGLTLANSTNLTDKAGTAIANIGTGAADSPAYTVDTIPPKVVSTVPLGASPNTPPSTNQPTITFQITFREPVSGVNKANFSLTADPTVSGASIASVDGSGAVFNVVVNTGTGDGNITLALANTNGLADGQGNPVPLPDAAASSTVRIDKTAPQVVSIKATGDLVTHDPVVHYHVTFSEPVTGLLPGNFKLNTNLSGANIPPTAVTGSGADYDVAVVTGSGTGTLQLVLADPTGVSDLTGNPLPAGAEGDTYNIDLTAPTVLTIKPAGSAASNSTTVQFDVTFSTIVSGVKATNFTLGQSGQVVNAKIVGDPVAIGDGQVWRVTADTGSGDGALALNLTDATGIKDQAGNQVVGVPAIGQPVTVDKTQPTVTIAPAPSQPNPAISEPVRFTVTFNEPVFGFGSGGLIIGGTAGSGIASVTGSPGSTTYSVTISGLTQSGQVTVSVLSSAASDAAGNASGVSNTAGVNFNRPVPSQPDEYSTKAKEPITVAAASGVLVNDGDSQSPARAATLVAPPAANVGTVTLAADGSFTFAPAGGFSGDAVFTYSATDGVGVSAPTTVTIHVGPHTIRIATSAGAGGGPQVNVLDDKGQIVRTFFAYDPSFTGGVQVAAGDVTGDAVDDVVVGTGIGGGPNVVIFDGQTGAQRASFFAYEGSFRGGVQVAVGDVNGDGFDDIITGTGVTGGPRIQVFSGKDLSLIANFFAFEEAFRGGVNVASGDVDGDGVADIIASPAQGGGPHVVVFKGSKGAPTFPIIRSFFAFDPSFSGGVSAAVGDAFGDGTPDIIAASSVGNAVAVFSGPGATQTATIPLPDPQPTGGLRLATKDTNNDGFGDQLLLATGPGDFPRIERFDLTTMTRIDEILDFPQDFRGGLYVG